MSVGRRLLIVAATTTAAAVIWLVGLVGIGQYTEDICFDDLEEQVDYGSYTRTSTLFPPAIECTLDGAKLDPVVVDHRAEASLGAAWGIAVPLATAVGAIVLYRRLGTHSDHGADFY
jgi:hypothetical protein